MNEKAPSHEQAVNLFYTCMRIARRVQPVDISEGSLNFQVPRNNNIDRKYNKSEEHIGKRIGTYEEIYSRKTTRKQ